MHISQVRVGDIFRVYHLVGGGAHPFVVPRAVVASQGGSQAYPGNQAATHAFHAAEHDAVQ